MASQSPPEYNPTSSPSPPPFSSEPLPGSDPISLLTHIFASLGLAIDITKLAPLLLLAPFAYGWVISLYEQISSLLQSLFWCYLECDRFDDEPYDQLVSWLATQPFANSAKNLIVTSTQQKDVYDENGNYIPRDYEEFEQRGFDFTPAPGHHRFWYKGHLIFYHRYMKQQELRNETIRLGVISRSPAILKEIYEEARTAWLLRDSHKTTVYRECSSTDGWRRTIARFPRPLSTVVLPLHLKRAFLVDLREYLAPATERWYIARGIPYRRGYLFYGPPGTGKSSLSFSIAGVFGLRVYVLSLASPKLTEERLAGLFASLPRRCVLLLEDVDAAFISRASGDKADDKTVATHTGPAEGSTNEKTEGGTPNAGDKTVSSSPNAPATAPKISFSALLNAIDGVASQEGRVLIMTTNHIEKLDPALIRPGRVDMRIEFKLADTSVLAILFKRMFEVYPDEDPNADGNDGVKLGTEVKCKDEEALQLLADVKETSGKPEKSRKLDSGAGEHGEKKSGSMTGEKKDHGEKLSRMAEEFARLVPSEMFSPAEIQGFLLRFKRKPEEALVATAEWVKEQEEEKKKLGGQVGSDTKH